MRWARTFLYNVLTRIDLIVCDFTLLCDDRRTDYRTEGGLFFLNNHRVLVSTRRITERNRGLGRGFVLFCFVLFKAAIQPTDRISFNCQTR
jgi:hypothetical protein